MKKQIFLLTFFFIAFSSFSLATCWFQGSVSTCSLGGNGLLLISGDDNGHIANMSETDFSTYDKKLCCDSTSLGPGYVMARLTAGTNAHIAQNTANPAVYPVEIRIVTPVAYPVIAPGRTPRQQCTASSLGDCLFAMSDVENSHIHRPCDQINTNYTYAVCLDPSGAGFPINMQCGDVFVDEVQYDSACDDTVGANPPSASCSASDSCVYTPNGVSPQCYNSGEIIPNVFGRNINCSFNNTWCPEGVAYNDALGRCDYPLDVCDLGYQDIAFAPPSLSCNNTAYAFSNFVDVCFDDFNIFTPSSAPYSESCCYAYEWSDNTHDFQFFSPNNIIVY